MDEQINNESHNDESRTRTLILSKLPDDEDPWAPNNLLNPEQKKKTPVEPEPGPSNRQEAQVQTN